MNTYGLDCSDAEGDGWATSITSLSPMAMYNLSEEAGGLEKSASCSSNFLYPASYCAAHSSSPLKKKIAECPMP